MALLVATRRVDGFQVTIVEIGEVVLSHLHDLKV